MSVLHVVKIGHIYIMPSFYCHKASISKYHLNVSLLYDG